MEEVTRCLVAVCEAHGVVPSFSCGCYFALASALALDTPLGVLAAQGARLLDPLWAHRLLGLLLRVLSRTTPLAHGIVDDVRPVDLLRVEERSVARLVAVYVCRHLSLTRHIVVIHTDERGRLIYLGSALVFGSEDFAPAVLRWADVDGRWPLSFLPQGFGIQHDASCGLVYFGDWTWGHRRGGVSWRPSGRRLVA